MVLAEKIVTAIQRGTANTRWRDFADMITLSRRHALEAAELRRAIRAVADYRLVALQSLETALASFARIAQPKWASWRRRLRFESLLPDSFADVLEELIAFADPLLSSDALEATWNPAEGRWT